VAAVEVTIVQLIVEAAQVGAVKVEMVQELLA
jgi:hypothetical protein